MSPRLLLDVERHHRGGPAIRAALDVDLASGQVLVLFGPSGSGKTTVLRCLAGLDRPDAGFIRFDGETWFDGAAHVFLAPQRRGVGLLFQDHALFPHLSVEANVGYGLHGSPAPERRERVRAMARLLGIEDLLARRPGQLSGGQRQRVALARAVAVRPRLLLLDEPLSALDAPTREDLRGELRTLLQRLGVPSVVVTHDRTEALALGDRLAVLAEGGIRQVGAVHEVFSQPADVEVARIVGTENVTPARIVGREGGLVRFQVGGVHLVAVDPGHLDGEAFACIRAEEVMLERSAGSVTTARNQLPGTVVAITREGPLLRVTLDCGFRLVALVTRPGAEQVGLAVGQPAVALVKAPAVRLVPRGSGSGRG
jgi:molybdate transport system ATP-binding protein